MGFYKRYEKKERKEDWYKLPDEKTSILPFLGYSYKRENSTKYRWHDGGYSVTGTGYGTYEVKKNPNYSDSYYYESAVFYRDQEPSAEEKELEQGKVKKNVAEIILAKNRAGACESFELIFKGERSKFINPPPGYASHIDIPPTKAERAAAKQAEEYPDDDEGYIPPEPPAEDADDIF